MSILKFIVLLLSLVIYPLHAVDFMSPPTKGAFAAIESPTLLRVTNLNSSGDGSFSNALNAKGPRLIVFEVSGVIDLKGTSITVTEPYATVAGQTAPGSVVIIRGGIIIKTHDIHISHLAIRPGDLYRPKMSGGDLDAISVIGSNARFVLLEHLSLSWGTDENLSISGPIDLGYKGTASDVWVRNCIIAEGLNNANHIKGPHSKGALVHDFVQRVAFVGNIFVSNAGRNPYFKARTTGYIANNWIVNPGSAAIELSFSELEWEKIKYKPILPSVSVLNNILTPGIDTSPNLAFISSLGAVYSKGNIVENTSMRKVRKSKGEISWLDTYPLNSKNWKLIKTNELKKYLIRSAGSRPLERDDIDSRILRQITSGESRIIDSQSIVGGYPKIKIKYQRSELPEAEDVWPKWLESQSNNLIFRYPN